MARDLDGGKQMQVYLQGRERHLKPRGRNAWPLRGARSSSGWLEHHFHEQWEKSLERKVRTLIHTWHCQALNRVPA